MRTLQIIAATSIAISLAFSFPSQAKDWSDADFRNKEISQNKCKTTLKRRLSFAKYWPPTELTYANPYMYKHGKVGFWGYLELGDIYYNGCKKASLEPDHQLAATWYQYAAIANLAEAQWKLGRMLVNGDGIPADIDTGRKWLISAAEQGEDRSIPDLQVLNEAIPQRMTPNNYETAVANAEASIVASRSEYWRQVQQDLGHLLVVAATSYGAVKSNTSLPIPISTPGQNAADICNCKGYAGPDGPCFAGPGGAAYNGPGGPAYSGPGGACYAGPGGNRFNGPGGSGYEGPGGPKYSGPGGPAYDGPGGPAYSGPGGACYAGPGGPCYSGAGGSGESCPAICR